VVSAPSTPEHSTPSSRQKATDSATKRPQTATEYATTRCEVVYPLSADLQFIVDVWPQLPEAVRAGIVAMVLAATTEATG
jgi:hypothetical protein